MLGESTRAGENSTTRSSPISKSGCDIFGAGPCRYQLSDRPQVPLAPLDAAQTGLDSSSARRSAIVFITLAATLGF